MGSRRTTRPGRSRGGWAVRRSTVSREIRRHGGDAQYRATVADGAAWRAAARPKRCRLATHPRLRRLVEAQLRADWSPQQISAWLMDDLSRRRLAARVARDDSARCTCNRAGRSSEARHGGASPAAAPDAAESCGDDARPWPRPDSCDVVSISERPPSADDRAVPGHWEGDRLAGTKTSSIATLVERHSRYVLLVRLPTRDTATVVAALAVASRRCPRVSSSR